MTVEATTIRAILHDALCADEGLYGPNGNIEAGYEEHDFTNYLIDGRTDLTALSVYVSDRLNKALAS